MAILQALFAFLGKSAGKILDTIFGWAVVALFGRTSSKEQTILSGLVGAAAAWPLLLLGIAFPKIATFVVAFVPLSGKVPTGVIRIVWLVLALAVPIVVGIVVASKAPPGGPRESFVLRMLRGFPITAGIAGAFVVMFLTVPALRIASAVRGRQDEHVPCITDAAAYEGVAAEIEHILRVHDLKAYRAEPTWWLSGPAKILQTLGGKALRGFMPDRVVYWKGPELEVALYPSDILIRGQQKHTAWTHGLLAEGLAHGPSLQTFDPEAQKIERQLRQVWSAYRDAGSVGSAALESRVKEMASELGRLKLDYDEWQVVYRQLLQLDRALHHQPQLLEATAASTELTMKDEAREKSKAVDGSLAEASTAELLHQLSQDATALVKKQIELARSELRVEVKGELSAAKRFGVSALFALATLNLLFVSIVLALAQAMPGWLSALIVAAALLGVGAAAAMAGWAAHVKKPFDRTQKTLKEDAQWAKERLM